ncbi:MAG: ATP-binding protein [Clostridia bacterium]|nr:ATP-binding protein [Clostridia bacterium]
MKLSIEWEKIKRGFRGFEKLAFTYVSNAYPNPSWKKTQETRDGNKDATAIFFGYQPHEGCEEKWWMEAKYSSSIKKITRYRLDSTIVSAILEQKIKRIIFVTNITINAKTINDIRCALFNAIQCNEVIFCTKFTLEHWLSENKRIYKKFFITPENFDVLEFKKPDLFVIQEIEYYSKISNKFAFNESLKELHKGDIYTGYFEVFSPKEESLYLQIGKGIKGITILSNPEIQLKAGDNPIKFIIKIEDDYSNFQDGKEIPPSFVLGNLEVLSAKHLIPSEKVNNYLSLSNQTELIRKLTHEYNNFIKNNTNSINFIEGISGSGKSYILDSLFENISSNKEDTFYANFSNSPSNNCEVLVNLLIFILFPFLEPSNVDYTYLCELKGNYISPTVSTIIKKRYNFDELVQEMDRIGSDDNIFNSKVTINRRIIVLDDLQKLSSAQSNFLTSLLVETHIQNLPVYFIGSAQPSYFISKSFLYIKQQCVIRHYFNNIGINDIFNAVAPNMSEGFYLSKDLAYSLEFNVLEILLFSKYILDNKLYSNNLHDFILTCKIFQKSTVIEKHILNQFNNLFQLYPKCRIICDAIYWSCDPVKVENYINNENEIKLLLTNGLIKYNHESCLTPIHEIYQNYYKIHFKPKSIKSVFLSKDSPEFIQYCINNEFKTDILNDAVNKTLMLLQQNKYYSVLYILQDLFECTSKEIVRIRFNQNSYYKLYYAYALASKHQNANQEGFKLFINLINEISEIDTLEILQIALEANWELAISHYERLEYKDATFRIRELYITIGKLIKQNNTYRNISDFLKFHDALMLDTLMRANRNDSHHYDLYQRRQNLIRKCGFIYRSESFRVRYALTQCSVDIKKCITVLCQCMRFFENNYGKEDKYFLWSKFHFYYYTMVIDDKPKLINEVISTHNIMKKNYYANYRNRLNGIAAFYYSIGDLTSGNRYLLKESVFINDLQAKQKAFHFETVALREMLLGNFSEAISSLETAINIFSLLPSYQNIPNHNIKILKKISMNTPKIEYWFGGVLNSDTYYIDSRCAW